MTADNWQSLGSITARITDRLEPKCFTVVLQGDLSAAIKKEAERTGTVPETVIAECVRAYLGAA